MNMHMNFASMIAAGTLMLAPLAHSGDLTVTITDIRSDKGHLMVAVVNSDAAWNNQDKPAAAQKILVSGKDAVLNFKLPAGNYAVQVMHDENDNGKLDANFMGIPTEGCGFSNNPNVLRRAHFEEARFAIGEEPASISIRLR